MVYVGYFLFSSYGITISIREVLLCLGGGMGHFIEIVQKFLKVLVGVTRSGPRPLLECPLCI